MKPIHIKPLIRLNVFYHSVGGKMEVYIRNYLLLEKYLKLSKETKNMILSHFESYQYIKWSYISDHRAYFKIEASVLLPDTVEGSMIMRACHDELLRMQRSNIDYITPLSKYYPEILYHYKPYVNIMFTKGNKELLGDARRVAIVGSRKPTSYGRKVAFDLGKYLAKLGVIIVSGMALGVDAQAHRGALDVNGKTIAVLASGVNQVYPPTNEPIYNAILNQEGLILSEQFIDDMALKHHFPLRNRIISAISDVVVIIEAGEKSGSLITATHAIEQGKTVFALPGNINSPQSIGCNQLIYEGAIPLISFAHIAEHLGLSNNLQNERDYINVSHLSDLSQRIYEFLKFKKTLSIEEIKAAMNCEYSEIYAAVSELILDDLCEYSSLTDIILV